MKRTKAPTNQEIMNSIEHLRDDLKTLTLTQEKLAAQIPTPTVRAVRAARGTGSPDAGGKISMGEVHQLILKDIQLHPGTVRKDIAERTKVEPVKITKIVSELQEMEKLLKLGSRRTTRWFAPEVLAPLGKS